MKFFYFTILILIGLTTLADGPKMNDISFLEFGDFTKTWKLVTVRYRQDTHEMRFTYANEKAWHTLSKGKIDYADGSVFAKIGFKSGVDPAFNSSVVPSGARRFQYMVKNSKKYSETDGWGYAVFKSDGNLFEGEPQIQTQSCHACHKLVSARGFVFSEAIEISPFIKDLQASYQLKKNESHIVFEVLASKKFTGYLKKYRKKMNVLSLNIITGAMRDYFFGGTLDEVTPLLINSFIKNKAPAAFVSTDQNSFKIILDSKKECPPDSFSLKSIEMRAEWSGQEGPKESEFCYLKSNL
jgi:hypothetical protein